MESSITVECLTSLSEFETVRDEWEAFILRYFPQSYAKTHAWLCAWWATYHEDQDALVFIGRDAARGKIVAAAPLFIRHDNFGGFPVRMLQSLGRGLGSDDFLLSPGTADFTAAVFGRLGRKWDVATFYRVSAEGLLLHCNSLRCFVSQVDQKETDDFYLDIPDSYRGYLKSRSSKFRNNLLQGIRRLEEEGGISLEVLDPFKEPERVWELCGAVARQSWQFKEGVSHFTEKKAASFYGNLAATGKGAGGEEFLVLLAGNKPFAFLFGCKRGRSYFLIDTAYDARYRNYSVGRVLFAMTIERLIEMGDVNRFYLEGGGDYKDHFATTAQTVHFLALYNRSPYAWSIRLLRRSRLYRLLKSRGSSHA